MIPALGCRSVRAGDAALHEPDVRRLALLVRLAPADGDQHPVAGGRVGDVGPVWRALTSLRRIPAMKRNPAIASSPPFTAQIITDNGNYRK